MDFESIQTWSNPEITSEVQKLMPADTVFTCMFDKEGGVFVAQAVEANGEVLWGTYNFDERLALLAAFGHFWAKTQQRPAAGDHWGPRRQELIHQYINKRVERAADPEDLDPDEVSSVYESVGNPKPKK